MCYHSLCDVKDRLVELLRLFLTHSSSNNLAFFSFVSCHFRIGCYFSISSFEIEVPHPSLLLFIFEYYFVFILYASPNLQITPWLFSLLFFSSCTVNYILLLILGEKKTAVSSYIFYFFYMNKLLFLSKEGVWGGNHWYVPLVCNMYVDELINLKLFGRENIYLQQVLVNNNHSLELSN